MPERQQLLQEAQEILVAPATRAALDGDLAIATEIDRAHLVMLAEGGVVDRDTVLAVLAAIAELRATGFAALRDRPAPRGWYLMYESYLSERLGPAVGGVLQLGRSRNDLSATLKLVRLRRPYLRLLWEAIRLQGSLIRQARKYAKTTMPAFTHHQPAVPITYGHYLAGVASALSRDIEAFVDCGRRLDRSPLGAGAVGGTSVPIDPARTATLLGFARTSPNSIDAIASNDAVLRLLAAMAVCGVLLGRIATDFSWWTSDDLGMLAVPDSLTGGSSMMPQKRNVFVLDHVQGMAGAPLGALVAASTSMAKAPFSNSIAVHTEGTHPVWESLDRFADALALARLVVMTAWPREEAMLRRAVTGNVTATEVANRLAIDGRVGFREAHAVVRDAVQEAIATRVPLEKILDVPGPEDVVALTEYGGGPGPSALAACERGLRSGHAQRLADLRSWRSRWNAVGSGLDAACGQLERR